MNQYAPKINDCLSILKLASWNHIFYLSEMRISKSFYLSTLCYICILPIEAKKDQAAHHQTGFGNYVADDQNKVSVRFIGQMADCLSVKVSNHIWTRGKYTFNSDQFHLRKSVACWIVARKYYRKKNASKTFLIQIIFGWNNFIHHFDFSNKITFLVFKFFKIKCWKFWADDVTKVKVWKVYIGWSIRKINFKI